ncbi:TrbI/VirB10 family protein [Pelagerythrobacter sp.]|uniref:TrbI/VirB10 family protein n=1 Tax=Pelagerythrobacter sp. TaxID=2800702 RepID=UPI0035B09BB9
MAKRATGETDTGTDRGPEDIRPVVARGKPGNLGLWVFIAVLLVGGVWLFSVMSANRADIERSMIAANLPETGAQIVSPPPLALPRQFLEPSFADRGLLREPERIIPPPTDPAPTRIVERVIVEQAPVPVQPVFDQPGRGFEPPAVVFDSALRSPAVPSADTAAGDKERVNAGLLINPALTVPQGTVVPAVLETALDSTRPGGVRALVQRDVHGFDGSRVLIPRGSRLYGEYEAGLNAGQNRALVRWTRLLRPDGVTIALDSPASDPLGRAGIRGKVDSKFFQRFGGAILQSVLDIGVGIATREATDGVVVALPGSTQNIDVVDREQVQRTLKVKHGTSVSVFVARDLDFSTVDS